MYMRNHHMKQRFCFIWEKALGFVLQSAEDLDLTRGFLLGDHFLKMMYISAKISKINPETVKMTYDIPKLVLPLCNAES